MNVWQIASKDRGVRIIGNGSPNRGARNFGLSLMSGNNEGEDREELREHRNKQGPGKANRAYHRVKSESRIAKLWLQGSCERFWALGSVVVPISNKSLSLSAFLSHRVSSSLSCCLGAGGLQKARSEIMRESQLGRLCCGRRTRTKSLAPSLSSISLNTYVGRIIIQRLKSERSSFLGGRATLWMLPISFVR